MLQHNFSQSLFNSSNIKYVVVPLQDIANDDDFFIDYGGREDPNIRDWYINQLDQLPYLKRVDIGTKELVVYENTGYKPYVHTFTTLNVFPNFDRLEERYDFVTKHLTNNLGDDFYFIATDTPPQTYGKEVREVFFDLSPEHIKNDTITSTNIGPASYTLYKPGAATPEESVHDISVIYKTNQTLQNAIPNPSFEQGLWGERVGDCNAYDEYPQIDMRLVTDTHNGKNALELEATRHVACTNQKIRLTGGQDYLLSFDYQGSPAQQAGYYLGFIARENATSALETISEQIPIKKDDAVWHRFTKVIHVPPGVIGAHMYFYAYASDNQTSNRVRYDNAHLLPLPPDVFDYWLVSSTSTSLSNPHDISFETINPTKKLVHVKGATTPFYLAMSESYHPQWQLMFNNQKVHGFFKSWVPWAHPDRVPDTEHFALNGFLNGWYVDTDALCTLSTSSGQTACTKNPDGSYDIEFVIEFFPQRWFYLGLLISILTFISCIGYLIYDFLEKKNI